MRLSRFLAVLGFVVLLVLTSSCRPAAEPAVQETAPAVSDVTPRATQAEALPEDQPPASGEFVGSCDMIEVLSFCYEYQGADWTAAEAREDCEDYFEGGTFIPERCPATERVASCPFDLGELPGRRIVYFFYAPMDLQTAEMSCPGDFIPGE